MSGESGSNGNGQNGGNGHHDPRQVQIEDALLLQVMPRTTAGADLAMLHGLRLYVQEIVKQEVVAALASSGELLQSMIRFQVSKQMKDAGHLEAIKEHVAEELEDTIKDMARDAGVDAAGEYLRESDLVERSDCESIAEDAAEEAVRNIDLDDLASDVAGQLDTDEIAQEAAKVAVDKLEDLVPDMVKSLLQRTIGSALFGTEVVCDDCGEVRQFDEMAVKQGRKWYCGRCAKARAEKEKSEVQG